MKKKSWIIIIAVALVGLMAFRLVSNKKKINEKKNVTQDAGVEIPVNAVVVTTGAVNLSLVKTGTLVPYMEADIAATTSGNLQSVNFTLGAYVQKGAVVAQIDNKMLQLKLEAAMLQQEKLQRDYDRYSRLLEGEATTETNLQEIKYNLDNATNQVSQIKKQMADNNIKAPVGGQIIVKNAEAGEFVSPGTVLGKVVDVSKLKVDVQLSENDAYRIKNGQAVKVNTELYPGQVFNGRVIFISQQGDAAHNYQVQIELPNSQAHPLKAGTFVYADFIQNSERNALQIPRSALVESMKNPYVYTVENGKALTHKITVGAELGSNVEVLDGLKEGDMVIVNGQINLSNGSAVRVTK